MPLLFRISSIALAATGLFLSSLGRAQQVAAATTTAPSSAPAPIAAEVSNSTLTGPGVAAQKLIAEAMKKINADDVDGALNCLSQALQLSPSATGAYVLRASLYCQKKQWTQAEDDFKAAEKLAPKNMVLKFNLVEIKFMHGQYDAARPGFLALENDPDMGDFASYKVFLCDLFGGHPEQAKKELGVFDDVMGNPSYYFANAAWCLVHNKDLEGGRSWLLSASRIYPLQKNEFYAQSLRDLGYLPIPSPDDIVTPPGATKPVQPPSK
jgi:Tfp pilus assembly protein PilF